MVRTRILIITAVALVFAGVASGLLYWYITAELAKYRIKTEELQPVVVASSPIRIGTSIKDDQLKIVNMPKESVLPGYFTEKGSVVGRIAVRDIDPGEMILEEKLFPKQISTGIGIMSYIVPQGHRAVTVAVNDVSGVAGFLNPKNRVDVVLTTVLPGSNEHFSKIILQNVPVLATGKIIEKKEGEAKEYPTVTLDLTPDDAEKLVLAASRGTLQMLLRNITDAEVVETKGADILRVLSGIPRMAEKRERIKKMVKVPSTPAIRSKEIHKVEIIRGSTRVTERF